MPSWKKLVISGSNAVLRTITTSGNVSGSTTSTGSFGHVIADNIRTSQIAGKSPLVIDADNLKLNASGTLSGSSASTASFGILKTANDFIVNSNGRVGINTTSPDYKLDVAGNIGMNEYLFHNGDSDTYLHMLDDRLILFAGGDNVLDYEEDASSTLKIAGGGEADVTIGDSSTFFVGGSQGSYDAKVGIGTSTPDLLLHLNNANGAEMVLQRTAGSTSGLLGGIHFGNADVDDYLASIYSYQDGATDSAYLSFETEATGGTKSEKMRITSTGLVGIGTTSPSKLLHLDASSGYAEMRLSGTSGGGTLEFYNDSTALGDVYFDTNKRFYVRTNGATTALTIDENQLATFAGTATISGGVLTLGTADTSSGHINAFENMSFNIDTDNDDTNRFFEFSINGSSGAGTELMRLTEAGFLGIGTTSPSHKLDVSGTGRFTGELNVDGGIDSSGDLTLKSDGVTAVTIYDSGGVGLFRAHTRVLNGDGTAGSPSFTFNNDADTGIFRVGANNLGISTGGTQRIAVAATNTEFSTNIVSTKANGLISGSATSTGSFGALRIGNNFSSPANFADDLVIGRSGNAGLTIRSDSANGYIAFADGTGASDAGYRGQIQYIHSSDKMVLVTAGANRALIDSSAIEFPTANYKISGSATSTGSFGHLVIGSDSTTFKNLSIDALTTTSAITVDETSGTSNSAVLNLLADRPSDGQDAAEIRMRNNSATSFARIVGVRGSADTYGDLQFRTRNASGLTTRLAIDQDGNVGIGTTSPAHELHLEGNEPTLRHYDTATDKYFDIQVGTGGGISKYKISSEAASNTLVVGNNARVGINQGSAAYNLDISANSGDVEARLYRDANVKSSLRFQNSIQHWEIGNSVSVNNEFSIKDVTDTRTPFHIDGSGNVGIGTTSPSTKLNVAGNILASGASAPSITVTDTTNTTSIQMRATDSEVRFGSVTNHPVKIGANSSTTGIVIDTSNSVGIGIASPTAAKLSLSHANNTDYDSYKSNLGATASTHHAMNITNSSNENNTNERYALLNFLSTYGDDSAGQSIIGNVATGDKEGNFIIGTRGGSSSANVTEKLRVTYDGKVGIGTESPQLALHVVGDIDLEDSAPFIRMKETGGNADMQFKLQTNGRMSLLNDNAATEVLTVLQSGNVGIGATSPGSSLDVAGEIRGQRFAFNDDTNTSIDTFAADQIGFTLGGNSAVKWAFVAGAYGMQFMYGTGNATYPSYTWVGDQDTGIYNAAADSIGFTTGGSERMRINSTGLGIGISNPTAKLHVDGDAIVTGKITAQEFHTEFVSASIQFSSGSTKFGDTNDDLHQFTGSMRIQRGDDVSLKLMKGSNSVAFLGDVGSSNDGGLILYNENGALTTLLRTHSTGLDSYINSTGNFGFGTNAPDTKIHIGGAHVSGKGIVHIDSSDHAFIALDAANASSDSGILFQEAGTTQFIIDHDGSANGLRIHNGSSEFVFVNSSGNVGIGTTSPDYTLDVAGNIGVNGVVVHNDDPDTYIQFATNLISFYTGNSGNASNVEITRNLLHVSASANTLTQDILKVDNTVMNRALHLGLTDGNSSIQAKLTNGTTNTLLIQPSGSATEFGGDVSGSATSTGSFGAGFIADKLGIGTTSPTDAALHINGSGNSGRLKIQQTSASDYSLIAHVTPSRQWNVGVGGASSASSLRNNYFIQDVTGGVTALILNNTTGDAIFGGDVQIPQGSKLKEPDGNAYISFDSSYHITGSSAGDIVFDIDNNGNETNSFLRITKDNQATELMRVQEDGKVGIGTTSPATKLDVDGAVTVRDYVAYYDNDGTTLAGYVGSGNDLAFGDANDLCIRGVDSIKFTSNNGNSDAMTIFSDGTVGIGISGTDGKLHVSNGLAGAVTAHANADELIVENSGNAGISILTPNTSIASIYFGDPQDNNIGMIDYNHALNKLSFTAGATTLPVFSVTSNTAEFGPSIIKVSGSATSTGSFGRLEGDGSGLTGVTATAGAAGNQYNVQFNSNGSATGGSDNFVFNSSNNRVGIGTSSPDKTLHLSDASRVDIKFTREGYNDHYIRKDGDYLRFRGHDDSTVIFELQNNANGNLASFPAGNVGIGTSSPGNPLHVYHATTNGVALFESGDAQGGIALKDSSTSNNVFLLATGDNFGIQTGGVANRLTVRSDGNVGIGTSSPSTIFHINADTNSSNEVFIDNSGTGKTGITLRSDQSTDGNVNAFINFDGADDSDNNARYATIESFIVDNTDGTEDGRLTFSTMAAGTDTETMHISSGHVSIGTSNVNYSSNSKTLTIFGGQADNSRAAIDILGSEVNADDALGSINFWNVGAGNNKIGAVVVSRDGADNSGKILLQTADSGTNATRVTIKAGGKVGLGTTSPTKSTHVNFASSDTTVATGEGLAGGVAGTGLLIQNTTDSTGVYANLDFRAGSADARIAVQRTNTNAGDMHFIMDNTNSPASMMVIKNDGKVGIGTTSPGEKLDVDGDIRVRGAGGSIGGTTIGNAALIIGSTTNGIGVDANELLKKGGDLYFGVIDDDDIFFRANSSTRMFIQSGTGNVGIGAGTPTELLHVQGNIKAEGDVIAENFIVKSTVTQMTQSFSSGSTIFGDTPADDTHQFTGSLSVTGSATITEGLRLGSGGLSNVYDNNLVIVSNAPAIFFDDTDVGTLRHSIVGGGNAGLDISADIHNQATGFINFSIGGSAVARMVEGGRIGIGQASPDGTLHVQSGHAGSVVAGTSADDLIVENSGDAGISVISPDSNSARIQFGSVSDNDIGHIGGFYNSGNEYLFFNVDGSNKMIINSTGVGIGTTSVGYPLVVSKAESAASDFQTNLDIKRTWGSGDSTDRLHGLIFSDSNSVGAGIFMNRFASHANYNSTLMFYINDGSSSSMTPSTALGDPNFVIDLNSSISLANNDNGTGNIIFGKNVADNLDAGSNYNVFIGRNVAAATLNDATHNIAIGDSAMNDITTADNNVAIGSSAMLNATTANQNVAIGRQAMGLGITTGASNVAIGYASLYDLTGGVSNVAVGSGAGANVTTGIQNILIGDNAGRTATTSSNIIAIGHHAGYTAANDGGMFIGTEAGKLVNGGRNTAIGFNSLKALNNSSGVDNLALGYASMTNVNSAAVRNIAIGNYAGDGMSTVGSHQDNIFIGHDAGGGAWNTTGSHRNIMIGSYAGDAAWNGVANNVGIGYLALTDLTEGDANVAIGREAAQNLTTGIQNVAIGMQALNTATNSSNCVIIGLYAGLDINNSGADGTVLVGRSAGENITSAAGNTAVGYFAGSTLTTGASNVVVGYDAMRNSHLGCDKNVVIGRGAFYNGEVDEAVFIGFNAGGDGTTTTGANGSVGIGKSVLNNLTDGAANVAIGSNAGQNITGGDNNTLVGHLANYAGGNVHQTTAVGTLSLANATGNHNTALGYNSGDVITSGTLNTILGYAADPSANSATNQTVIGASTTGVGDNSVTLGNADVTAIYAAQDRGATIYAAGLVEGSSMTLKENIAEIESPLDKLTKLRGVEFDYKSTKERSIGMIAEEVNEVFPELVNKNEDGEVTAMSYSRMTAVLLEAVKELSQEVKDSREEIRELKKLNNYSKAGDKN